MYYVYLLKLNHPEKQFYIGSTSDIKRRIQEHKSGRSEFTKSKLSVKLIYFECYPSKELAIKREKSLKKSGSTFTGLLKRIGLK